MLAATWGGSILQILTLQVVLIPGGRPSGITLSLEDVVSGVRRILNESALTELEGISISFPERKKTRTRRRKPPVEASYSEEAEKKVHHKNGQASSDGEPSDELSS